MRMIRLLCGGREEMFTVGVGEEEELPKVASLRFASLCFALGGNLKVANNNNVLAISIPDYQGYLLLI